MQPCNPMFQCSIRFHITLPPPYAEIHKAQPFQLLRTWVPPSPLFSFPHFLCRPCTFPVSVFFLRHVSSLIFSVSLVFFLLFLEWQTWEPVDSLARVPDLNKLQVFHKVLCYIIAFIHLLYLMCKTVLSFYQMPAWFCCCCYCCLGFFLCFFNFLFSYSFLSLIPYQFFASH